MENETAGAAGVPAQADSGRMSFPSRLTGVYFEPRKVFQDVARYGGWLLLYVLVVALVDGAYGVIMQRVDPETIARKQIESSPMASRIPPERMEEAVRQASSPARRYMTFGFIPIGVLITYLLISGVLLLVFVLMGVSITFKKSLALTIWGMGPPTLLAMIVAMVIVLVRSPDTIEVADPANNVTSNLGPLADAKEQPVLHSALGAIDLFSFWRIYLLGVGFAAASAGRLTVGRAIVGVGIPWAVYVGGKLAFAALWG